MAGGDRDGYCHKDPVMEGHDPYARPVHRPPGQLYNRTHGYRRENKYDLF